MLVPVEQEGDKGPRTTADLYKDINNTEVYLLSVIFKAFRTDMYEGDLDIENLNVPFGIKHQGDLCKPLG